MKKVSVMSALLLAALCLFSACSTQTAEQEPFEDAPSVSEAETPEDTAPAPQLPARIYEENGLTAEENQQLQASEEVYEAMTEEEQQVLLESGAIACQNFVHLPWEGMISMPLIDYVGFDEFDVWAQQCIAEGACTDLYSYAEAFDVDLDTMLSLITNNNLEDFYPLEQFQLRYGYFLS